jgi:proliferating cell nuclear antigen
MFEAKIKNPLVLKKIFYFFGRLEDTVLLQFKPEGVLIKEMDRSHVCMAEFFYPKHHFEKYICDELTKIKISTVMLNAIFQKIKYTDLTELKVVTPETKKDEKEKKQPELHITVNGEVERFFSIIKDQPYFNDPEDENEDQYPTIDFDAGKDKSHKIIFSKPEYFFTGLRDAELCSGVIILSFEKNFFLMSANDSYQKQRRTFLKIPTDKGIINIINNPEIKDTKCMYPIPYLKPLDNKRVKIRVQSENMKMWYKPDYPLLIEFPIKKGGYLKFYIAPRVEEKEDEDDRDNW